MSILEIRSSRITSSLSDSDLEQASKLCGPALATKYSNLNVSVESLEGVSSEDDIQPQETLPSVAQFNAKLKCYRTYSNVFVLTSISQITELLDLYYDSNSNPLAKNLFPYLHGLYNDRQRIFFNDRFKNTCDQNFDLADYQELNDMSMPSVTNFNLMTVNTNSKDANPKLVNSVALGDLFDFSAVSYSTQNQDLNNRNYKLQIKLMANLSHFLVYNNNCNIHRNLKVAMKLSQLIDSDQFVYVLNFDKNDWPYIPVNYTADYNYKQLNLLPVNSVNNETFSCKLLKWEQNMLWKRHSMKWFTNNVCLGNLIDYNALLKKSNESHFKLAINCTEATCFPRVGKEIPTSIDFPSSGTFNFDSLSYEEMLSFVNLLQHIHHLSRRNEKIFIFSFDGFTGLSLLTLAVGMMLTDLSLEQLILSIYSDDDSITKGDLKLYFFMHDLVFLKKFESTIKWIKKFELQEMKPVTGFKSSNINQMNVAIERFDWFNFSLDNNFPCKIYKSLHLGSVHHANSFTVLNCLKIKRVLSVGERPIWLGLNRYNETNTKPIYTFKNAQDDDVRVFEITVDLPQLPHLKTLIYIQNSKDDGKDSLLPLFMESPPHIQSKILVDPESPFKTLVHCKIGVSRSASICIATLMKHQQLSLIESYMLVRVNRFNIIIQPNLRLFYDLYYYEDYLNQQRGYKKRSHTWWNLCAEIHKLNSHYINE